MKKSKAKRPKDIETKDLTCSVHKHMDPNMYVALGSYSHRITLKTAKQLHLFLGQAIQYLESGNNEIL